jgi:hypothetical protein
MFLHLPRTSAHLSSGFFQNRAVSPNSLVLIVLTVLAFLMSSCSSTSVQGPASSQPSSSNITVQVTPSSAEVESTASLQLAASLTGTNRTGVMWTTDVGSISNTGLFKAPSVTVPTQARVTATSQPQSAGASSFGSATITILPAGSSSALSIATTSLPAATVGTPYDAAVSAAGGSLPYTWSVISNGFPSGLSLNSAGIITGTANQPGNYSFQLQVKDALARVATGNASVTVSSGQNGGNYDGPAELPRTYLQTAMSNTPAPGTTTLVAAGEDFQSALDNAQCGQTIELQAGATFTGLFTIPAKACDDQHWIVVRTSASDASLPAEGVRISPCYAGVNSLPGRPAFHCNSTQQVMAKLTFGSPGAGPIQFLPGANHYRFVGLEITRATGTGAVGSLVSAQKNATADQLIIDRSWVHGTSQDETTTGVALGGLTNTAIISSYLNDFHCTSKVGTCTDSHAVSGGNGTAPGGPYAIVDNFLEAAGENVLFGGGTATTTPTDIQISQNHFFKPLTWMLGSSGYVGGTGGNPFVVKNHLELKNAQRVLAEDNIFEDNWGGFTQTGHSIVLTPKDQSALQGNVCPICQVTDVTIRYSTVSHVGAGIVIADVDSPGGGEATAGERYSIHDVVIDDISVAKYDGGGGFLEYGNGWNANVLNSALINHVTAFPDPLGHLLDLYNNTTNPTMWGFTFTNNIVSATNAPVWNGNGNPLSCAVHDMPLTSLTACFESYSFTNNVIPAALSRYPPSTWPSTNFFPATATAVQFVNYNSGNGGNYQLAPNSPYKNSGSDGKDPGANISLVEAGIAGVY